MLANNSGGGRRILPQSPKLRNARPMPHTGAAGPSGPISMLPQGGGSGLPDFVSGVFKQLWDLVPTGSDDHFHNQMRKAQAGRPFDLRGLSEEQQRRVQQAYHFSQRPHDSLMNAGKWLFGGKGLGGAGQDLIQPFVNMIASAAQGKMPARADLVQSAAMFAPGSKGGRYSNVRISPEAQIRADIYRDFAYRTDRNVPHSMGGTPGYLKHAVSEAARSKVPPRFRSMHDITTLGIDMLDHLKGNENTRFRSMNSIGGLDRLTRSIGAVNENRPPLDRLNSPTDLMNTEAVGAALEREASLLAGGRTAKMDQLATPIHNRENWLKRLGLPGMHSVDEPIHPLTQDILNWDNRVGGGGDLGGILKLSEALGIDPQMLLRAMLTRAVRPPNGR